jgi:hypothetical protein
MQGGVPTHAERPGRAALAALPSHDQLRPAAKLLSCDLCGRPRSRHERRRLVWEREGTNLVLAELCCGCAALADSLVELYGAGGREAIMLVEEIRVAPQPRTMRPRALGFSARGLAYLAIALVSFLLVTVVTSRGR